MDVNQISLAEKKIESSLSSIAAKVADAQSCSTKSAQLLLQVQNELSELYISLGDLLETEDSHAES